MKNETRWYRLWYFTAAMWAINFLGRISSGRKPDFFVWLQLANAFVSLGAGIANRKRYLRKQDEAACE